MYNQFVQASKNGKHSLKNCFIFFWITMKQEELQKIFEANKVLDEKFCSINKDINNLINCNKIELMAELMELANSSRVFKYRKNEPMDYEDALYEYVDWLLMIFFFFDINNEQIKINEIDTKIETIKLILELIDMYNWFINKDVKNLNEILEKYILLWEKIWFKENDITRAALDKIQKTMTNLSWK